jgi:post-segregation antitoxin (ccd killing protein)
MARRNISLADDLDDRARRAGLNVSALAQQAVAHELDRRARMARLDAWLDELDRRHGPPSAKAVAAAEAWVASAKAVPPRRRGRSAGAARPRPAAKTRRAAG